MTANASVNKKAAGLRKLDREADILDAAREVFTLHGFHGASISDIASRVGVAEGTLYLYFANKRELLGKVIAAWYEGLVADVQTQLPRIEGLRPRIRYLVWRHCRVYCEDTGLAALMVRELRQDSSFYDTEVYELNRRYTRFILDVVKEGRASGEVTTSVTPERVRDVLYGGLEHTGWKVVAGRGSLDPEQVADEYTDMLLAILGVGPVSRSQQPKESVETRLARLEQAVQQLQGECNDKT